MAHGIDRLKNEQAIEALADIFDPIMEIASDNEIVSLARSGNNISLVKTVLKKHARSVFEIMAILDNTPIEEYECNMLTLPAKLLELFNRQEFNVLFQSQGQMEEKTFSGSATENITEKEK